MTIERLRFTFTPNGKRKFVPRDQVSSLTVAYCLLLPLKIKWFHASFIYKNCSGQFLSAYLYSNKFSTWIWRLPFAVNVTLNLANNGDGSEKTSPKTQFEFALPKLYSAILIFFYQSIFFWSSWVVHYCRFLPTYNVIPKRTPDNMLFWKLTESNNSVWIPVTNCTIMTSSWGLYSLLNVTVISKVCPLLIISSCIS